MSDDYVELTGDDVPYHLRPESPPTAECDRCHRQTWAPAEEAVGWICLMTQPDGRSCGGTFVGTEKTPPQVTAYGEIASRDTSPTTALVEESPNFWDGWLPRDQLEVLSSRWGSDDLYRQLMQQTFEPRPRCEHHDEDGDRCTEFEHGRRHRLDDGHRYGGPHGEPTWTR